MLSPLGSQPEEGQYPGNPGLLGMMSQDVEHDGIRFGRLKTDSGGLGFEGWGKKEGMGRLPGTPSSGIPASLMPMAVGGQGRCHVSRGLGVEQIFVLTITIMLFQVKLLVL